MVTLEQSHFKIVLAAGRMHRRSLCEGAGKIYFPQGIAIRTPPDGATAVERRRAPQASVNINLL
jgi:hypothetical protein